MFSSNLGAAGCLAHVVPISLLPLAPCEHPGVFLLHLSFSPPVKAVAPHSPAFSPIPTSGISAHPWMAEYSFPPCLIAVNTNSSSFFRLFCRFLCLPNCFHSLTPLQAAPPQKQICLLRAEPQLPTQLFFRAERSGCPSASDTDSGFLLRAANSQVSPVQQAEQLQAPARRLQ